MITMMPALQSQLMHDAQATAVMLEWPTLEAHILALFQTPYGMQRWQQRPSLLETATAQQAQWQGACFRTLVERYGLPVLQLTLPRTATEAVQKTTKQGVLTQAELADVLQSLTVGRQLLSHALKWLPSVLQESPAFMREGVAFEWLTEAPNLLDVYQYLQGILTLEGEIKDEASPELAELRRTLKRQEQHVQEILQSMLANPTLVQCLQDPIITYRFGRPVLPVNVFHKAAVPGIIHDTSSTGSTVFIEPKRVVEQGNRLDATRQAIHQEIRRILKQASEWVAVVADEMFQFFEAVAQCDTLLMVGQLAKQLDATPLRIVPDEAPLQLHWKQLRHPLLVLNSDIPTVVPNTLQLGATSRVASEHDVHTLMITGPNTGGKTVLLKAVGLLMLMLHAGLLIPVAEGSYSSLMHTILADIGDSQSIQHNLSTFSGQVNRLTRWLPSAEAPLHRPLFLIDEIAAGTDPTEGAALAKVFIRQLHAHGGFTLVSTHLGELKLEAHHQAGYQNASVLFDVQAMQPTYQLHQGTPGASNALRIAQRLGVPEHLIDEATHLLQHHNADASELLTELETQRLRIQQAEATASQAEAEWKHRLAELKAEQQGFRESKKQQLLSFQAQFKSRLSALEDQAKRIKKELRKAELGDATVNVQHRQQQLHRIQGDSDTAFDELLMPLEEEAQ
ncbi:MAG: endonuclease MutS2, partial [Vampirovibrionales bacterium]